MNDSQSLKKKVKKFIKKTKPSEIDTLPSQPQEAMDAGSRFTFPHVTQFLQWVMHVRKPKSQTIQKASAQQSLTTFKKYERDLQLILIPFILLLILGILTVINKNISESIEKDAMISSNLLTEMQPYPFVKNVTMPELSAKAAIILDIDSKVIIFSKNPNIRFSMASTTKIMTAIIGLEYYKDNSILTVKKGHVEGAGLGLQAGDRFYFEDLLYAMLLPSANDAAQTIADNYPGGEEAFVKKMNEKADKLSLLNTHYADPTGLDDDGDYTTVVDLAHLASYAITNKKFAKVTSTREYYITNIFHTRQYPLYNLNRLLGYNGVTGIKTGTTEGAGEVLVTSTRQNGHIYIIVVMHSTDRFADTQTLLDIVSDDIHYVLPTFPTDQKR